MSNLLLTLLIVGITVCVCCYYDPSANPDDPQWDEDETFSA
jgi:hypothetical protein